MSVRVHAIAKEINKSSKELIEILTGRGYDIKSASASIDNITAQSLIDEFFISPYHPDNTKEYLHLSHLRKPGIGMLELAESKWAIDRSKSFLIGDKNSDIECAKNFLIRGHLFKKGNLLNFIKSSENF